MEGQAIQGIAGSCDAAPGRRRMEDYGESRPRCQNSSRASRAGIDVRNCGSGVDTPGIPGHPHAHGTPDNGSAKPAHALWRRGGPFCNSQPLEAAKGSWMFLMASVVLATSIAPCHGHAATSALRAGTCFVGLPTAGGAFGSCHARAVATPCESTSAWTFGFGAHKQLMGGNGGVSLGSSPHIGQFPVGPAYAQARADPSRGSIITMLQKKTDPSPKLTVAKSSRLSARPEAKDTATTRLAASATLVTKAKKTRAASDSSEAEKSSDAVVVVRAYAPVETPRRVGAGKDRAAAKQPKTAVLMAEVEAIIDSYTAGPREGGMHDGYGVWHDHAPSSYVAYLEVEKLKDLGNSKQGSASPQKAAASPQANTAAAVPAPAPAPAVPSEPAEKDEAAKSKGKGVRKECVYSRVEGSELPGTSGGHFFSVANVQVDVKAFMSRVEELGGFLAVTQGRLWSAVSREFGIDPQAARFSATSLKRMHALLAKQVQRASGGRMHWRDWHSSLVIEPFLDLLADRERIPKKGGKKARAARAACQGSAPAASERKGEGRTAKEGEQMVIGYLMGEVGVSSGQVAKALNVCPQLRHLSVDNNLRPTVEFLMGEAMVPANKVAKVVGTFPQILGLSVESNLRPMLTYLTEDLGISGEKIGKVLVTRPQLLASCVGNLLPKIQTLLGPGQVPEEMIGHIVTKAPHLLGLSNTHILEMISFLTDEVGVERARVGRLIVSSPQLLGLSIECNLRPKIRFLVQDIGVPKGKVGSVIGSFPNILGYSVEANMLPKLQYLAEEVLEVPLRKMGRAVVTCPQLLGYSLEKRIKPRHQLLLRRSMHLSISRMLAPSDLEFRRMLRTSDRARREREREERDASMPYSERIKLANGRRNNGLPQQPDIGDEAVPLSPETMSGLYYWHFNKGGV